MRHMRHQLAGLEHRLAHAGDGAAEDLGAQAVGEDLLRLGPALGEVAVLLAPVIGGAPGDAARPARGGHLAELGERGEKALPALFGDIGFAGHDSRRGTSPDGRGDRRESETLLAGEGRLRWTQLDD